MLGGHAMLRVSDIMGKWAMPVQRNGRLQATYIFSIGHFIKKCIFKTFQPCLNLTSHPSPSIWGKILLCLPIQ